MPTEMTSENPSKPSMNKMPRCTREHLAYLARIFLTEMLGVGLVMFVIVLYQPSDKSAPPVPFVVGAVFAWVVCVCGPISGGQVNPAVSLALILTRRLSLIHGMICIVAQVLGATCGTLLGQIAGPANVTNIPNTGMTFRSPDITVGQAIGLEAFGTMILVGIVLSVCDEFRSVPWTTGNLSAFPIVFGITLFLLSAILGPYSGGSMNPAISFGAALANLNFYEVWIYIVGPVLGSLIITLGYELLLSDGASWSRLKALATERNFDRTRDYKMKNDDNKDDV